MTVQDPVNKLQPDGMPHRGANWDSRDAKSNQWRLEQQLRLAFGRLPTGWSVFSPSDSVGVRSGVCKGLGEPELPTPVLFGMTHDCSEQGTQKACQGQSSRADPEHDHVVWLHSVGPRGVPALRAGDMDSHPPCQSGAIVLASRSVSLRFENSR